MTINHPARPLAFAALAAVLLSGCSSPVGSSASEPPAADASMATTVDTIRARMLERLGPERVVDARLADIRPLITPQELQVLSSGFLSFSLAGPATVYVMQSPDSSAEPFWLESLGFERSGLTALVDQEDEFTAWRKRYPAGPVTLGVPSIEGEVKAYFVLVGPEQPGGPIPAVEALQPAGMALATATVGTRVFADDSDELDRLDPALEGLTLVRTLEKREDEARLMGFFRRTPHPSGHAADHVLLTWSGDPATSQSVQWRTAPGSANTQLRYAPAEGAAAFTVVEAISTELHTPDVANDTRVLRHTVWLEQLQPGTTYRYAIGDGSQWGEERQFTSAPAPQQPFSFVYMGDAQVGLDTWGKLVRKARAEHPQAAFYVMAGDLVNWGERRDDWDLLFQNAESVFDNRPLVPAIGNHEVDLGRAELYVEQFDLPRNGPPGIEPERVYAMEYGNAQFVVLDSNLPPEPQVQWLDETLGASAARWKFVVYHHPLYSTKPNDRGQPELKAAWAPIFEKHGVDLVLQGDDHAYLRTYPMQGDRVVGSPAEGPIYLHAVSGTKMYRQSDAPYIAKRFTDIATYQVIDIDGGRLEYKAYDLDGRLLDAFTIQK